MSSCISAILPCTVGSLGLGAEGVERLTRALCVCWLVWLTLRSHPYAGEEGQWL